MKTLRPVVAGLLLGTMTMLETATAAERNPHGLAQALLARLAARKAAPQIHATDFQGVDIGCIILPRRELRPYGYPGHAMLCEVNGTGEVLGAVMGRTGNHLCDIAGAYVGDFCYDFDICGYPETLCTQ